MTKKHWILVTLVLTVSVVAVPQTDVKPVVVIDVAHGGPDLGNVSETGDEEKTIVLGLAQRLSAYIEDRTGVAVMTRTDDDHYVTLEHRREIVQFSNASAAIGVHLNSSIDSAKSGWTIMYNPSDTRSRKLAEKIFASLSLSLPAETIELMKSKLFMSSNDNSKPLTPFVLLQCGFITNANDRALIKNDELMSAVLSGVADTLIDLLI